MRYYDKWGRRIPSPRGESVPLSEYVIMLLLAVMMSAFVMYVIVSIGG